MCLLQKQPDESNIPIECWSLSLNDAELAHDISHGKCPAVKWAVFWLRPYLEGSTLIVRTDEDALKLVLYLLDLTYSVVHWRLRLSKSEFGIIHCTCIRHQAANKLWRINMTETDQTLIDNNIPALYISPSNAAQKNSLVPAV